MTAATPLKQGFHGETYFKAQRNNLFKEYISNWMLITTKRILSRIYNHSNSYYRFTTAVYTQNANY